MESLVIGNPLAEGGKMAYRAAFARAAVQLVLSSGDPPTLAEFWEEAEDFQGALPFDQAFAVCRALSRQPPYPSRGPLAALDNDTADLLAHYHLALAALRPYAAEPLSNAIFQGTPGADALVPGDRAQTRTAPPGPSPSM
jgi:hypothetical protein